MTEARTPLGLDALHFERFRHHSQLDGFGCGNDGLDHFILSDEVFQYEREQLAKTWLVRERHSWAVVAYYATSAASVHVTHAQRGPGIRPDVATTYLSSLQIGRLAVQQEWQGRGIGRTVLTRLALDAIQNEFCAFRLITLAAEPESVAFYETFGFQHLQGHRYKNQRKPMMFFDLKVLAERLGLTSQSGSPVRVGGRLDMDLH